MSTTKELDLEACTREVNQQALDFISNQLKRPEHLDTVDHLKRNALTKKSFVEAKLKTAVQKQLDYVKNGIDSLNNALTEIRDVKENMNIIESELDKMGAMKRDIAPLRESNDTYVQLRTANTHLTNIISVVDICISTESYINEGEFLLAHKNLMTLERTRDDLLRQLHESNPDSQKNTTLKEYFDPVLKLSNLFFKQMSFILQRILDTARSEPKHLVTVLRIIEREEKADKRAEEVKFNTGFAAPGRPKGWRDKAKNIFKMSISSRFQMFQMDDDDEEKWLSDTLIKLEQSVLEELTCVSESFVPCFPPDFNIVEFYVTNYHRELTSMFDEISNRDLAYSNIIVLLESIEHLKRQINSPPLNINIDSYGLLISKDKRTGMETKFKHELSLKLGQLTQKIVEEEREEWHKNLEPEANINGHYHTSVSLMLFEMVSAQIELVKPLGLDMYIEVLGMCLEAMNKMITSYKSEINKYYLHVKQASDRNQYSFCLPNMMAFINNTSILAEELGQLYLLILSEINSSVLDDLSEELFEKVKKSFQTAGRSSVLALLDIVFDDLDESFQNVMTKKWIGKSKDIDVILVTIEDYAKDFRSLRPGEFAKLIIEAQERVIIEYIKALLDNKRSQFKNTSHNDRAKASHQLKKEADNISKCFYQLSKEVNPKRCEILKSLADIIGSDNAGDGMLSFEVGILAKSYDIKPGHIYQILLARGDISKVQAKQIAEDSKQITDHLPQEKREKKERRKKSEYSRVSHYGELPNLFDKLAEVPF